MLYIPYPFKRCPRCGNDFPATSKHFYRNRRNRDGLRNWCKPCTNADVAQWKREHPEWTVKRDREYYLKHSEHIKEQTREYRVAHAEQVRKRRREYYAKHTDQYNTYTKRWAKANPERARDSLAERCRKYRHAHPGRIRATKHRRRAAGVIDETVIQAQYKRQKGRCYYCNAKVGKDYHLDHVVPISRGGTSDPDNLVIACPSCNLSKNDKLPHEWAKGGRLL